MYPSDQIRYLCVSALSAFHYDAVINSWNGMELTYFVIRFNYKQICA